MKPLIVGEAPSKNEFPPTPLEGRVGRRLADCAGLTFGEYLTRFDRTNLLGERQEVKGKGFVFDMASARAAAWKLRSDIMRRPATVLLGKRVCSAFNLIDEYFLEQRIDGAPVFVVPHPSGLSRWWNDVDNRMKMREFMRALAGKRYQG